MIQLLQVQLSLRQDDVAGLKNVLDTFSPRLHQNHALLTETRQHLAAAIGRVDGYRFDQITLQDLLLKKVGRRHLDDLLNFSICLLIQEVSLSLLSVCDILEPGLSKARGVTLMDLGETLVRISNIRYNGKEVDMAGHLKNLREAEQRVAEAVDILKFEDEMAIEGKVAKQARTQLEDLRAYQNYLKMELPI